jgi:hypothetical protein
MQIIEDMLLPIARYRHDKESFDSYQNRTNRLIC